MPLVDIVRYQALPLDSKYGRAIVSDTRPVKLLGRIWLDTSAIGRDGLGMLAIDTFTADITLTAAHTVVRCDATAGPFTVTPPDPATNAGKPYAIKKIDPTGNVITVAGVIDGASTQVLTAQYDAMPIVSNGVTYDISW